MKLPIKGPIPIEDALRYLEENEDYQRRMRERDLEFQKKREILLLDQQPILADLKTIGWEWESVGSIINIDDPCNYADLYDRAIPILEKHVQLEYMDETKEAIARALTVPVARSIWSSMVAAYEKTPGTRGTWGAKWAMGNALSVYADKNRVPELIRLALDQSGGFARTEFIRIWWRFDTPEIRDALNILVDDPFKDVADLARSVLKKIETRAERKRLKKEAKNTKEK